LKSDEKKQKFFFRPEHITSVNAQASPYANEQVIGILNSQKSLALSPVRHIVVSVKKTTLTFFPLYQKTKQQSALKSGELPAFTKPEFEDGLPYVQDIKSYFVPTLLNVVLQAFNKYVSQLGSVSLIQFCQVVREVMCAGTFFHAPSVYEMSQLSNKLQQEALAAKQHHNNNSTADQSTKKLEAVASTSDIELKDVSDSSNSNSSNDKQASIKHLTVLNAYMAKPQQAQQQLQAHQIAMGIVTVLPRTSIHHSVKSEMLNIIRFCCFNIKDVSCIEALYAMYMRALHDQTPQIMLPAQALLNQL